MLVWINKVLWPVQRVGIVRNPCGENSSQYWVRHENRYGDFRAFICDRIEAGQGGLDVLHFAKIDLADEVLVLNVDDYIGESTEREIVYAEMRKKTIRYLEGGVNER